MTERAEEALRQELYWGGGSGPSGPTRDLRLRIERLADALQADLERPLPEDPAFAHGSPLRRAVKWMLYRLNRPLTRRHDRSAAELAAISLELLDHLGRLEDEIRRLRESPGEPA